MSTAEQTRAALLREARKLFWTRGYSNVPLRQIARAAGVDVALVARYFGSKRGLFDATLADLPRVDPACIPDGPALVEAVVTLFAEDHRADDMPGPTSCIIMNSGDEEVGDAVRSAYAECWQRPMTAILGDPGRAALFSAAMLGMGVAEQSLRLDGIAPAGSAGHKAQLRRLLSAALDHGPTG